MKFRKKPEVIEAFQMTLERRWDNKDWPEWLHQAWNKNIGEGAMWCAEKFNGELLETLFIGTLGGVCQIEWGDWIIKGIKGELYPCKPDIFEATYEKIE